MKATANQKPIQTLCGLSAAMGQQEPPPPPAIDEAEREELAEQIRQHLRDLEEIEAELKKQRGDQPLH
jgi:transposase